MQFHLPSSTNEILWALTFAGYLVLLVVLLGRDRVRRFPWFTANAVLITFRLLSAKMLYGRLPQIPMAEIFIGLALLGCLVTVMMLMELARKGLLGIKRKAWVGGALILMGIGAVVLATWGQWPARSTLMAPGLISHLQLLQLIALKATLFLDVETILLGLVIVVFGRRFRAGWQTHVQRIMIGLSTISLAQLAAEAITEAIGRTAHPQSMAEYQKLVDLRDRIFYANSAIGVLVLIWWIVCLWRDEPGSKSETALPAAPAPADSNTPQQA
jgi:hypothetical protein